MAARSAAPYIDAAIDSLRAQTYEDWELVVVDDGSTDDTAARVHAHARDESRIRLIRTPPRSRGAARNTALAAVSGEFVAICDADDTSVATRYEQQVDYLRRAPEIGVLGAQVADFGAWGGPEQRLVYPTSAEAVRARFLRGQTAVANQACMIRKALFDRVSGYDPAFVRCQDLEWFLRALKVTDMAALPDVVVHYRTDGAVSLRYWLENAMYRRFAAERHLSNRTTPPTFAQYAAAPRSRAAFGWEHIRFAGDRARRTLTRGTVRL
jgi:glycosyltransferase involved in cell wall biosynthesis